MAASAEEHLPFKNTSTPPSLTLPVKSFVVVTAAVRTASAQSVSLSGCLSVRGALCFRELRGTFFRKRNTMVVSASNVEKWTTGAA